MYKAVTKSIHFYNKYQKKSPGCNIENHSLNADHSFADFSVLGIVKLENPPPDPINMIREFEGYWMIKLNQAELVYGYMGTLIWNVSNDSLKVK